MRSLAKLLTRLLPILFILFFACQPEEEQFMENDPDQLEIESFIADAEDLYLNPSARLLDDIEVCGDPIVLPLKYFRYYDVGKVILSNSEESLLIQFETNPGIVLEQTMLVLVLDKKNKINSKHLFDKDKIKKVMYSTHHESGATKYLYEIPRSELDDNTECVSMITIAKVKDQNSSKRRKIMYSFSRQEKTNGKSRFNHFFHEYCFQDCNDPETAPETETCEVQCNYGFGIPSVEVAKSFSFEELDITDWAWGYAHEIKHETLFRLPIKLDNSESADIIGQVTVMIDNDIAYVYFQMNDGYPMNKTSLYFSHALPESGIPCSYTYNTEYTDAEGTWIPTLTDTYVIENVSEILTKSDENNDKLYLIAYTDFCK